MGQPGRDDYSIWQTDSEQVAAAVRALEELLKD